MQKFDHFSTKSNCNINLNLETTEPKLTIFCAILKILGCYIKIACNYHKV